MITSAPLRYSIIYIYPVTIFTDTFIGNIILIGISCTMYLFQDLLEQYSDAIPGPDMRIIFESKQISLEVPFDLAEFKNWEITPLKALQVLACLYAQSCRVLTYITMITIRCG